MTIKECPNCPGATEHTAADCPIKPDWSVDTDGILRNAQGEWVAELVAWDKEKLAAMLEGEAPPQDSPNVEWPVSLMESALTGKPATGRCITCNCTTPCGKLFCEDHSYLAPVDQPSAAQSAPDDREAWTASKPTEPGAYWVRGSGLEADALVQVKLDDGELWCNLHMRTTEPDFGYGYSIEQLSDEFEWLGPLHFGAAWQRAQSAPVVPEGWRLVPVEPTDAMLAAYEFHAIAPMGPISVYGYRAMLAAASKVAPHG